MRPYRRREDAASDASPPTVDRQLTRYGLSAEAAPAAVVRPSRIRAGRMVILVDDEDRENEGDLVMAADLVTPEAINFMARDGRGLICLSLTEERVAQLGLPMMAADNRSAAHTAFTVSVDARHGMTTGISARERAETIRVAVARDARPDDLVTPGPRLPAARPPRRRAGALRAHRGLGRPGAPGRARAGRRHLRDHARRRRDGAHARAARRSRASTTCRSSRSPT